MKLLIIGYGKMGKAIARLSSQYGFLNVVIVDNEEDWIVKQEEIKDCKVAIEFSTPQSVLFNLSKCFELQIPVVCGTTGWKEQKEDFLKVWRNRSISFIFGSNFSIGANIFFKLNEYLAQQMNFQPQYNITMEETHHVHKKDVPSGTALTLKQSIISQYQNEIDIPITSHREGEVIGEHQVSYNSMEENIQLKHMAHTRDAFAHGALKAAKWLIQNKGVYEFENIFDKL